MLDLAIQDHDRRVGVRVAGPRRGGRRGGGCAGARRSTRACPATQRVIATGQPAFVEEVRDELLREIADRRRRSRAAARGCGARSAITLPLATRGAPFGALSLIIGSSGRRYAHDDLEFAGLVQGRIAIVLDNTGLSRAAARSEAIMSAALDSLEEAVTMNGPDGTTVYVNQAAVRLLRRRERRGGPARRAGRDLRALSHLRRGRAAVRLPRPARVPRARRRGAPRAASSCATSSSRPGRSAGC